MSIRSFKVQFFPWHKIEQNQLFCKFEIFNAWVEKHLRTKLPKKKPIQWIDREILLKNLPKELKNF